MVWEWQVARAARGEVAAGEDMRAMGNEIVSLGEDGFGLGLKRGAADYYL